MLNIETPDDFKVALAADMALLDFWAPWCGPCQMQAPALDRFAAAHPDVLVAKVNVDKNPALTSTFRVRSIPTLVLLSKGELAATVVGLQTETQLADLVAQATA